VETLRVTIALILGMALPFAVQRWDRRRLTEEQRSGAWNAASWGAALYGFGPLSMIAWCWVTRHAWSQWRRESILVLVLRSASLLLKGVLASLVVGSVTFGVDALLLRFEGDAAELEKSTALLLDSGRTWLVLGAVILGLDALLRLVAGLAQPRTPTS
jgi:hypothetical protein